MRGRIVDAALHTLTSTGYANTSVRAIATTGGFSPALVFYHFGSVDALLLAVLDRISGERLSRYETMKLEEIMALPVAEIAALTSHLYLWCPNAMCRRDDDVASMLCVLL